MALVQRYYGLLFQIQLDSINHYNLEIYLFFLLPFIILSKTRYTI